MKQLLKISAILAISIAFLGCGSTRVVFVDTQANMVRLGKDVTGHVYVLKDGEWVLSKNKVKLPEGWYAGALPASAED